MKNMMKKTLVSTLALFLLAGCGFSPAVSAESAAAAADSETALPAAAGALVSERDASGDYDAAEAVRISPGDDLTITEAGVYILSGEYAGEMLIVDAGDEAKVQLVLENAELSNESGPAIYVRSADKVFITAAEGTVNTISDGSDYSFTDEDTTPDAAVFSKADLTVNGAGTLTVNGNCKHGIVSKDDLVVTAENLTVSAANVGLNGKDSVVLSGAAVHITAGSDGIRSDNGEDAEKGTVALVNSAVTIVSGKDGIQAETVFTAENSNVTVTAGGGAGGSILDASESCKAIKAGVSLTVESGVYELNSLDDAIHTDGSLRILDGTFTIQSGDDGVHANENVEISGGTLNITAAEGIETTGILISGGDITIQASDDGINAAWKSSADVPVVEISGGNITITMGAGDTDGIDSNGNLSISGGTISINAASAFDCDGSTSFTGGTLYVNGQQLTTIPNQMMGGMGGHGNFGGHGGFGGQGGFGSQGGFGGQGGVNGPRGSQGLVL